MALDANAADDAALRVVHTRHYDIHTDIDEPLVTDLSRRMDAMFEQYSRTFAEFKPPANAPPLAVYLFETHEKYTAFTDYAAVNTGGIFVSGRRSYLAAYEQGQGRDALRRTLQHEAFHQFAHSTISRNLPPWINEGMAQTFEESIWTGQDFLMDQIPPLRLRQLRADINQQRLVDFAKFLAITPKEWTTTLHSNIDKAGTWYNQAWAMACFCSTAGDDEYHARFARLLQKLHADRASTTEATKECFPDLKDFRRKFNAWAAKLQPTPQATLMERQDTLGDFLLAVSTSRPPPPDVAAFRDLVVSNNLKIQYTRGKLTYSSSDQPIQYFSDLSDRVYSSDELFFKTDPTAALPDIICQPSDGEYRYRTHFYDAEGKTEHEVRVSTKSE